LLRNKKEESVTGDGLNYFFTWMVFVFFCLEQASPKKPEKGSARGCDAKKANERTKKALLA
jgi:hypothetical protein